MKVKALLLGLLLIAGSGFAAFAEDTAAPAHQHERMGAWKAMTPEERQAKRAEWRQKFQNMTPEEKQALKAKRQARFQSLPPEKQQAIRQRMEQRRAGRQQPQQASQ